MSLQDVQHIQHELEAIRRKLGIDYVPPEKLAELKGALDRFQGAAQAPTPAAGSREPARPARIVFGAVAAPIVAALAPPVCHLVRLVRLILSVALVFLVVGFLVLFGLAAPHPPKWDTWWWVVQLQQLAGPLLTSIDQILEWPHGRPYYPFALAVLVSIGRIIVDTHLGQLQRQLKRFLSRRADKAPVAVRPCKPPGVFSSGG